MHLVPSNHLLSSWRVELGSGGLDEVSQVLVKGIAAGNQRLSIQQHGHGFAES